MVYSLHLRDVVGVAAYTDRHIQTFYCTALIPRYEAYLTCIQKQSNSIKEDNLEIIYLGLDKQARYFLPKNESGRFLFFYFPHALWHFIFV